MSIAEYYEQRACIPGTLIISGAIVIAKMLSVAAIVLVSGPKSRLLLGRTSSQQSTTKVVLFTVSFGTKFDPWILKLAILKNNDSPLRAKFYKLYLLMTVDN